MSHEVLARSKWTSTSPGGSPLSGPVGDLFIHHTAGPLPKDKGSVPAVLRATREYHVNVRGYSDIAYCYAADSWGRIWILRGHRTGGHTYGHNSTSIAFVFLGNSDAAPSDVLDAAAGAMAQERARQVELGNLTKGHGTRGHRDVGGQYGGTACPGDGLYGRLGDIRSGIHDGEEDEDMGFKDFAEAAAERWNQLLAGEATPKAGPKIPKKPEKRDAALGRRFADGIFAALKGHK